MEHDFIDDLVDALVERVGKVRADALVVFAVNLAALEGPDVRAKVEAVRTQLANWLRLSDEPLARVADLARTATQPTVPNAEHN